MTSRERKNSPSSDSPLDVTESNKSMPASHSDGGSSVGRAKGRTQKKRDLRRRQLFQTLEQRHLLAGPQLIGIQPNEGSLITDGTVRDLSPRLLTFGFDQGQSLDASTFDGIKITRGGEDGLLGTADDVDVQPGLISLGDPR